MGLVTARVFAEAGAAVALSDVNEKAVRSAADQLVAAGHKAIGIRCNVADEADVETMVAQSVSTFGRLDAAFNNAGVQSPAKEIADVSGEEFDRVNGINLRGVWNCMKYELRQMREQGLLQGTFTPSVHAHVGRTQPLAADGARRNREAPRLAGKTFCRGARLGMKLERMNEQQFDQTLKNWRSENAERKLGSQ